MVDIALVTGFVGALAGGVGSTWWTIRRSTDHRLEDAYTELAGAAATLIAICAPAVLGTRNTDAEWIEFERCRARVKIQETRAKQLDGLAKLKWALDDLHSKLMNTGPVLSEEEHREREGSLLLENHEKAEKMLEAVLTLAKLDRRWYFLWLR